VKFATAAPQILNLNTMKDLSRDEMKKVLGGLVDPPHCVGNGGRCDSNTRCCGKCQATNIGEGNNIYTCQ